MNIRFGDPQVDFGARHACWKKARLAVRLLSVVALLGAVGVCAIHPRATGIQTTIGPNGHPRVIDAINGRGSCSSLQARGDVPVRHFYSVDNQKRAAVVTIAYRRDFGLTTIWPVDAPACVSF